MSALTKDIVRRTRYPNLGTATTTLLAKSGETIFQWACVGFDTGGTVVPADDSVHCLGFARNHANEGEVVQIERNMQILLVIPDADETTSPGTRSVTSPRSRTIGNPA